MSVLDAPRGYAQLGLDASSGERVVITGEGGRSMQVAERVATGRRRVTLLLSSWQHGAPSPTSMGALLDAAARRGVSVQGAKVARALGARSLEAVLVHGEVVPCDVLAVVPRRVPGPVPGAATGRHGGVEVGLDMRSAVPGVLSAGGCAELHEGSPPHATLVDEEGPSGRVAGANAAGHRARLSAARCFSRSALGVTWTRRGTGAAPARAAGLDAVAIGRRDAESACTIVYDRATGAVLGLETVEARYSSGPVAASMGPFTTLRSLAYEGSLGSSDISMVSETARLGLEAWSRS